MKRCIMRVLSVLYAVVINLVVLFLALLNVVPSVSGFLLSIGVVCGLGWMTARLYKIEIRPGSPPPDAALLVPWTTAPQDRYDDMRAKGWSALAAQQAADRLQA